MPPSKNSKLMNIGPKSAQWLREVEIETWEDLAAVGVIEVYLRVKDRYPEKVSLNLLYGLEGAYHKIDWRLIPEERRAELRAMVKR